MEAVAEYFYDWHIRYQSAMFGICGLLVIFIVHWRVGREDWGLGKAAVG
jgi:hypothetical protein